MEEEKHYLAGILVEEGVELMAVAGTAEVFASLEAYTVCCLAEENSQIRGSCGLRIVPDGHFSACHHLDVLVLPGTKKPWSPPSAELLRWVQAMSIKTSAILADGSGVAVLAAAGLLEGRRYTTSLWEPLQDYFKKQAVTSTCLPHARVVADGELITTAGGAASLEGALKTVELVRSKREARQAANRLAYPHWQQAASDTTPKPRHGFRK